ncbi:MAG: cation:proton antiporter, partial [Myxococcota bacterium]
MAGGGHTKGNPLLQLAIVVLLTGVVIALHAFSPRNPDDATSASVEGLLAFGFVVLASYTIGLFVDVIKLPHITGYLLAGAFFGPSVAHFLSANLPFELVPPLDRGILSGDNTSGTIGALSLLDTLAIALIALTAGGELKLDSLRRGLRAIIAVLSGQIVVLFLVITAFIAFLLMGMIPYLTFDVGREISMGAAVALGMVVASIAMATSPAATIAVINDKSADGPMTRTVLSSVVLKDVLVVVAFSLASTLATSQLGVGSDQSLGTYLLIHIGGSMAIGAALAGILALYLRFVGRELLLVIVGVVYAASLLASALELDPVLLFMAAGFTISNFSKDGDSLIHGVERLSMPVYVVFFTLAGAKLHLEDVFGPMGLIALAMVILRAVSLRIGVGAGARLVGADQNTRTYGWLGFLSQAGVAISLAGIVGNTFGDLGDKLKTLIIAGVAINEVIGPVALDLGLKLSGEAGQKGVAPAPEDEPAPTPRERPTITPWKKPAETLEPLGAELETDSEELGRQADALRAELHGLLAGASAGPIRRLNLRGHAYFQEIRRLFLRNHRRLTVQSRSGGDPSDLAVFLRTERRALVAGFRNATVSRADELPTTKWSLGYLVDSIDRTVEKLPEWITVGYEPSTFSSSPDDNFVLGVRRFLLRLRRGVLRVFRRELRRRVPFRALARYHFSGAAPAQLERVAATVAHGEAHLTLRAEHVFEQIQAAYDEFGERVDVNDVDWDDDLRALRMAVEKELDLADEEVERIARATTLKLAEVLSSSLRGFHTDIRMAGTPDLSSSKRRSSRVFHERLRAIQLLRSDFPEVREALGAGYRLVALELELHLLEAELRAILHDEGAALGRGVRGKLLVQAERVNVALEESLQALEEVLAEATDDRNVVTGEKLVAQLR